MNLPARQPIQLDAGSQAIEIEPIARLWIDDQLLLHPAGGRDESKPRGLFRALGDGRIELVAQTVVEHQARRDLPRVLGEEREPVSVDGGGANVVAPGKVGGRDGGGVDEGASAEQTGQGVRQRVAGADVMQPALRRNIDRGIGGTSAKVILPIGADAKVGRVTV